MELVQNTKTYDLLGATASGLCAIHCTLTPLMLVAKPMLEGSTEAKSGCTGFWIAFDYIFLGLSFIAVWYSTRHTDLKSIKFILWIAWILFSSGVLAGALHLPIAKWLMYTGSIALVITHCVNIRYCAKCHIKEL